MIFAMIFVPIALVMKEQATKFPKLTPAQKREYEILKLHGSCYVSGWRRHGIFDRLVEKGLAKKDLSATSRKSGTPLFYQPAIV